MIRRGSDRFACGAALWVFAQSNRATACTIRDGETFLHFSFPFSVLLPPRIAAILSRFSALSREDKMAALVSYARKLEPVPTRLSSLADDSFAVPECQTPVRIFPEVLNGNLHFFAEIDTRQSPTVAAFLSIVFSAVNDEPPATTLAIPQDFVRSMMQGLGLGTREVGLDALVARLKRHARDASLA